MKAIHDAYDELVAYKRTTPQFQTMQLPAVDVQSDPEGVIDQLLVEMTGYLQNALKTEDMEKTAGLKFQQLVNRVCLIGQRIASLPPN